MKCNYIFSGLKNHAKHLIRNYKLEIKDIPITHATMKSRLKILIENEQTFDALQILKEAETTFHLKPDEELFTLILQEPSVMGSVNTMKYVLLLYYGN